MKRILIIGAGFLQRFVIRKAKELGYYTLAVDGNPNAVGFADADEYAVIDIVDQRACLIYARAHKVDGVLTAATDYGVLSASYVAKEMNLPGISYEAALRIKDKYAVWKCLHEAGADEAGFVYRVSKETDMSALAQIVQYPVMVKPCDGSGSRGVTKAEDGDVLADACAQAIAQSLTGNALVEPFIDGEEYGVESFVENGNIHVLGVIKKWMTQPPYYAELGHGLPSGLPLQIENKIKSCAQKAISALGIHFGSVNMDLLLTKDGRVQIVDVGARMGGNLIGSHIIPIGTGIDYMAGMIRGAVGDPVDMDVRTKPEAIVTRILALKPGVVNKLPDFATIEKVYGAKIEHHLTVGQKINQYRTNLDGCGYIVSTASDVDRAIPKAEQLMRAVDDGIGRL
jgi:biotin carboxylase